MNLQSSRLKKYIECLCLYTVFMPTGSSWWGYELFVQSSFLVLLVLNSMLLLKIANSPIYVHTDKHYFCVLSLTHRFILGQLSCQQHHLGYTYPHKPRALQTSSLSCITACGLIMNSFHTWLENTRNPGIWDLITLIN